jgi:DNA (cytosine-5)-methyltransferase 1
MTPRSDRFRRGTPNPAEFAKSFIPTPTTRDYKDGAEPHERDGKVQTDTVARAVLNSGEILLPTTRTSMANGASEKEVQAGNPKARLEAVTNWGKFEPAIRRWEEVLGRPAPSPTKPDGKEGAHRLSSAFTEWMMGVPEGWITDCGLKRNEELKACGNGVVPQQAELALRILLEGFTIPTGGGASESTNANSKRHIHGQPKKLAAKARVDALSNTSASGQDGN